MSDGAVKTLRQVDLYFNSIFKFLQFFY